MEGFKLAVWLRVFAQTISITFECIIVCDKIIVGVTSPSYYIQIQPLATLLTTPTHRQRYVYGRVDTMSQESYQPSS